MLINNHIAIISALSLLQTVSMQITLDAKIQVYPFTDGRTIVEQVHHHNEATILIREINCRAEFFLVISFQNSLVLRLEQGLAA